MNTSQLVWKENGKLVTATCVFAKYVTDKNTYVKKYSALHRILNYSIRNQYSKLSPTEKGRCYFRECELAGHAINSTSTVVADYNAFKLLKIDSRKDSLYIQYRKEFDNCLNLLKPSASNNATSTKEIYSSWEDEEKAINNVYFKKEGNLAESIVIPEYETGAFECKGISAKDGYKLWRYPFSSYGSCDAALAQSKTIEDIAWLIEIKATRGKKIRDNLYVFRIQKEQIDTYLALIKQYNVPMELVIVNHCVTCSIWGQDIETLINNKIAVGETIYPYTVTDNKINYWVFHPKQFALKRELTDNEKAQFRALDNEKKSTIEVAKQKYHTECAEVAASVNREEEKPMPQVTTPDPQPISQGEIIFFDYDILEIELSCGAVHVKLADNIPMINIGSIAEYIGVKKTTVYTHVKRKPKIKSVAKISVERCFMTVAGADEFLNPDNYSSGEPRNDERSQQLRKELQCIVLPILKNVGKTFTPPVPVTIISRFNAQSTLYPTGAQKPMQPNNQDIDNTEVAMATNYIENEDELDKALRYSAMVSDCTPDEIKKKIICDKYSCPQEKAGDALDFGAKTIGLTPKLLEDKICREFFGIGSNNTQTRSAVIG